MRDFYLFNYIKISFHLARYYRLNNTNVLVFEQGPGGSEEINSHMCREKSDTVITHINFNLK